MSHTSKKIKVILWNAKVQVPLCVQYSMGYFVAILWPQNRTGTITVKHVKFLDLTDLLPNSSLTIEEIGLKYDLTDY
jgi:hypothetical protein